MNKKILTVLGARPHFIKAAALNKALAEIDSLKHILVHSGQHYDEVLSGRFFREFNMPEPDYNLNIGSGSHNQQIGDCIIRVDKVLDIERPDMVLVYGDTNTTLAATLAASKRDIRVAHVEAGLREYCKVNPEEVNKLVIDRIADLLFAPTQTAVENLRKEGIVKGVHWTGDIALDHLYAYNGYDTRESFCEERNLPPVYVFMTCHREVNTVHKDKLEQIIEAISELPYTVIFALHPRTRKALEKFSLISQIGENVRLIDPPGFWTTQHYIKYAKLVLTDSGGIIKESYFHKVPVIILDTQTEWLESIKEGFSKIAGPDKEKILHLAQNIQIPVECPESLGDGHAAGRIVRILKKSLNVEE